MRIRQGGNLGTATGRAKLAQRREPYWVVIVRGCALGYRKGAKGGTWIARVRREDGRHEYEALGPANDLNDGTGIDYEAAQAKARKWCKAASTGGGKVTVGEVLDTYLEHVRNNNPASTVLDTEKRITGILKPAFGEIHLSRFKAGDITRWRVKALKDRKPDTVNRLVTILKAALNYAWKEERLIPDDSEWRSVSRLKGGESRKIFLTAAQSRDLVSHCKGEAFRNLVQAALLTGARYGELTALKVRDFDAGTGTLEIGGGKTGARTVYLSNEAVAFFGSICKGRAGDALILPREGGEQWGKNHHQKPFVAAVKAAKLDENTTFYALRHTHISLALLARVNIQVLAENCGTSVRMIEQHYGKFLKEDRRAMFRKLKGLALAEKV
jgi:integrase